MTSARISRAYLLLDTGPLQRVMTRLIQLTVPDADCDSCHSLDELATSMLPATAIAEHTCHTTPDNVTTTYTRLVVVDYPWLLADPSQRATTDVAIARTDMPGLIERCPDAIFAALVNAYDEDQVYAAVSQGFRGVVVKASMPHALATAFERIANGQICLPAPPDSEEIINTLQQAGEHLASDADRELLQLILAGHSPVEIATRLQLPARAVQQRYRKLFGHLRRGGWL